MALPLYAIHHKGGGSEGSSVFAGTKRDCIRAAELYFGEGTLDIEPFPLEQVPSWGVYSARKLIRAIEKDERQFGVALDPTLRYNPR